MNPDDRATIQAALAGDEAAFEMVIRMFSRPLYAVAYGVLQNREEAEDTVQETFLKAWGARWRLRDPEKLPAWLASVARNRARDLWRRRRTVPLPEEHAEIADADAEIPHETMDAAELHHRVHCVLAGLPEHHRVAVTLRYLEGLDHQAIEQTMGLSNGALRGILGRALGTMRKGLKPALNAMERQRS